MSFSGIDDDWMPEITLKPLSLRKVAERRESVAPAGNRLVVWRGKSPEEAGVIPRRPVRSIRDRDGQLANHAIEQRGGLEVHRLRQIVRKRVIPVCRPLLLQLRLR